MAKPKPRRRTRPKRSTQRSTHSPVANETGSADLPKALQLQKQGRYDQARRIYCEILKREPDNADAWHLLGMTLFATGEYSEAINCLGHALDFVPEHPDVLANLGAVHRAAGDLEQARVVLERAVSGHPESPAVRINLGTVLLELSELDLAEAHFQAALQIQPDSANAAVNLGNVWQKQGRRRDAEQIYRRVLEAHPHDTNALNNLGETLRHQGDWEAAASAFEKSLELDPSGIEARINLGRTLVNLFRNADAQKHFRFLIERHPQLPKPYHYFGKTLFEVREMEAAAAHIEKSLELDPNDIFAKISLGFAYLEMGRIAEAVSCYEEVLERDPMQSEARSTLLFLMSNDAEVCQDKLFEEHKRWGRIHGNVPPIGEFRNDRTPGRRLKIGYVSPDFRDHAVATYFLPVLKNHDAEEVETFCYAEVKVPDRTTEIFQQLADHWRSTKGLSAEQVAKQIHSDEIDILVDLAGHVNGNRLTAVARRPAPVQVTWIGYPNTTGLESIDYRLTCETQNPSHEPSYHTEQLVRMPGGSFCFSTPKLAPEINRAPCLESGIVTFGSFHRPLKISSAVRDLWADVLNQVPDSRLLVFNTRFTRESTEVLATALEQRGVSRDRFKIRNKFSGDTYLNIYREVDIGLDVFPWAGATTTLEALWMGVPVVALYGERRSARSTAAILQNSGFPELVARSPSRYVEIAHQLADSPNRIEELRNELRGALEKTILDAARFTKALESEYRAMWRHWCESGNQSPSEAVS